MRFTHWPRLAVAALILMALAACAVAPPAASASPRLRLSPASLGATLALQQQLTVKVGAQTHRLEVLLEADAQTVRVAVLSLGQTAARLEWDGTRIVQSRAAWWPDAVSAERILDDLQLMLWPAPAVSAALPAGWTLASSAGLRVLSKEGVPVVRVRYEGPHLAELTHLLAGYSVHVQSRVLELSE
jgi:hypothetical protein